MCGDLRMKILFLARGYDQIAFMEELRRRGNTVYLVDYNEHPLAEQSADAFFKTSTLDVEAVEKTAKELSVDMILTACTDQALLVMAYISKKLGLPCYLSYEQARNVTNKAYMKGKMLSARIPTAKGTFFDRTTIQQSEITSLGFAFPLVIKPCDCNSSKGVIRVDSFGGLREAMESAMELSRDKKLIIEEFQEGREYSVDLWILDGKAIILGVSTSKKIKGTNSFTIVGSVYDPNFMKHIELKALEDIATQIADEFSINNMPLLMQVIKTARGFQVIEFSPRIGGGTKYKLIEYMSGIEMVSAYIDMVLDMPMSQKISPRFSSDYMELDYLYVSKGTFCGLSGFEAMLSDNIIQDLYIYKPTGTQIKEAKTSSDRIGGVLFKAPTTDELQRKRSLFFSKCCAANEHGENILMKQI